MLKSIYTKLLRAFGSQGWWRADSLFEICVGIILVQRTTWINADKAIDNLKRAKMLDIDKVASSDLFSLEQVIKPAGFYKQKAKYLQAFACHARDNYKNDLSAWFRNPAKQLRQELLTIKGVGSETADSILLYAANKPIFVVDAYTKRIFYRLGVINNENISYLALQDLVHQHLKADLHFYNEFHALLVKLGKEFCRTKPSCGKCSLKQRCKFYQERITQ